MGKDYPMGNAIKITLLVLSVFQFQFLLSKDKSYDPRNADLKKDFKSIRYDNKDRQGCCKIKYPSGGYDFFVATESECRQNLYFDRYLGDQTALCFQWKD